MPSREASLGRCPARREPGRSPPVARRALAWTLALCACGGGSASTSATTVFDPSGGGGAPVDVTTNPDIERPYPPLDETTAGGAGWSGVSVLRDGVRFTRPARWQIRDASLEPGHSFIRYLSPDAFSFAIYERTDSPGKSWKDILAHYEADVTANGAKAIGQRVPMATAINQGRAYTIDRKIDSKEPVLSRSREILLRGEHRIVLVQIVTSEENLSRLSDQLIEILRRIEVL
jgi:hypothetical protein